MFVRLFLFLSSLRRPTQTRVRIFHTNDFLDACLSGYRPEHTVSEVFTYDVASPRTETDVNALLSKAFHLFSVGDDPAHGTPDERAVAYRRRRNRSLSVGDIVEVGGSFYACKSRGWSVLDTAPRIEQRRSHGTTPLDEVSSATATRGLGELLRRAGAALPLGRWGAHGR
jgi:hypothetical protein